MWHRRTRPSVRDYVDDTLHHCRFQTTDQEIKDFFKGCEISAVHMVKDGGGRSSGEAFVVVRLFSCF
jgi:hypothetical protein